MTVNWKGLKIQLTFKQEDVSYSTDSYETMIKWISKEQLHELHCMIILTVHKFLKKDRIKDIVESHTKRTGDQKKLGYDDGK